MARVTIITKLRFMAVIAPIILLVAAPILALGFYGFGAMPALLRENQYAALEAARGMENALYKMDWARTQPEALQIVQDQQRGFVGWIEAARSHASTEAQHDAIEKIAEAANPIFDAMRAAPSGDDSLEPRLRDLQGLVSDLISADDAAMLSIADRSEARAQTMIIVTAVVTVIVPWLCFIVIVRMTAGEGAALREIRRSIENIAERAASSHDAATGKDLEVIDTKLAELGYPKPNPMLAE
jgi:membrane protein required for beta-lactamase induction